MLALHNSVHFECVNYIESQQNQVELVAFSLALRFFFTNLFGVVYCQGTAHR
jgi:hypothetical protein